MRHEIAGDDDPSSTARRDWGTWIELAAMLTGALALRLALIPLLRNKQTHDLRIFVSWAQLLMQYGSHHLYQHVDTIDHFPVNYPPLFALVLGVVDAVYLGLVSHHGENLVLLGMLLKLPAITADLVLCVLVFVVVRRWAGPKPALGAVALAAFAPSTWPISALWGQVDSICTTFMTLALTLFFWRRYTLAWSALALAVLVKPLPVVVAPLLLVAQLRDQGWSLRLLAGPACVVAIAYLVSLPFAPTVAPIGVMQWVGLEYLIGQSLTESTSVNAYNLWTLAWLPTSDSQVVLALTLHAWGWLAFSGIIVPTTGTLFRRLAQQNDRVAQEQLMTRAWFIVLVGLFLFVTRMHERYILFALALAPLMLYCGRYERRAAVTLIVTFTICVILVLGFYEHNWLREATVLTHLLSLINLSAFAAVMISYFRRDRDTPSVPAGTGTTSANRFAPEAATRWRL